MLTRLIKKGPVLSLLLGLATAVPAHPLGLVTVSGECQVTGHGLLRVFLVDERSFAVPMSGIQHMVFALTASGPKGRRVAFSFSVPQGTYAIRCYLDVNGNGALDRGLFGPLEPWGMSWRSTRPSGFPRFADIAFAVSGDVSRPLLVVE
jgi:uncharacterized protein (DUF2141 family)